MWWRRRRRKRSVHEKEASAATPQQIERRVSRKRTGKSKDMAVFPVQTRSPEKRPYPQSSTEDLTALPVSQRLASSPHLRPVTSDLGQIPYNFQGHSQSSLQVARERGKLQRPQSLRKRSANDSALVRRKSSKKRKPDHVREEEIRAMSAPIPIPKRPRDSGLLHRDSKKIKSGLNRHLERPESTISLPLEDSIHSSMSGGSESRAFRVSSLDVLSPRPKIRYSLSSQFSPSGNNESVSRHNSKKEKRTTVSRDTLMASRTVDDLADDLDSSGLRALMERDQRRRERRRKEAEERLLRRVRREEKRRAKEQRREQEALDAADKMDVDAMGGASDSGEGPSSSPIPARTHDSMEQDEPAKTGTFMSYPQGQIPSNLFADPSLAAETPQADFSTPLETPAEEPVLSTAHAVRYSQGMSPPTSPSQHARGPSNVSEVPELASETVQEKPADRSASIPSPSSPPTERRGSEPTKRLGFFPSIFRRTKRESLDRGRTTPSSDMSFSNTSRESMSRQPPPAHLVQQQNARAKSGTPVRTQSKFREDLPELPISPPDSRMQSPEVGASAPMPIPAGRRRFNRPENIHTGGTSSVPGASPLDDRFRTDSPVSPTAGGASSADLMSHSLASVDSEGSWLSGKPVKRSSRQTPTMRNSVGSSFMTKRAQGDFTASYEDLGVADEEYFRRNQDGRRSGASGDIRKASSTLNPAMESDDEEDDPTSPVQQESPEETIIHNAVARQPTMVHRDNRVKSTEGLLNYFQAGDIEEFHAAEETQGSSPGVDSSEQESPTSEVQEPPARVERARSVDMKGHVRHLSAGSAKILDIPARTNSEKRASATSQP